jgi:3-hydroxybutyryl-CoA dehydrogenase
MKKETEEEKSPLLVSGSGQLAFSITVCLLLAGHRVTLYTADPAAAEEQVGIHLQQYGKYKVAMADVLPCKITSRLPAPGHYHAAVAVTAECGRTKKQLIAELESILPPDAVIAVNTESIPLSGLQQGAVHPARIIGANWAEPAHTTLFLEMIVNGACSEQAAGAFREMAGSWGKDPYVINGDEGIRSRMQSAMAREAFYLVENGYASIEDIDRACRNDAGYYLPFAGNFRYMDLMGPYAYGLVMKDLNPELARGEELPAFVDELVSAGHTGMEAGKGFYEYNGEEADKWKLIFSRFSYRIQQLMSRYPFAEKQTAGDKKNEA